jgi:hypothetical protein
VFLQLRQSQPYPQSFPEEKHSQYILRQAVFLHVQPERFFLAELVAVGTCEILYPNESSAASGATSPVPVPTAAKSMFSKELCCGKTLTVLMSLRL